MSTDDAKLKAALADAVARAEAAGMARAELEKAKHDLLSKICERLNIDLVGGADWVLSELYDRLKGDADSNCAAKAIVEQLRDQRAELFKEIARMAPWYNAAKECAEVLGIDTPDALLDAAKALSMDQHPPARASVDVTIQHTELPTPLASKPHRVAQAGGHDLGVLVGYTDPNGLFRVTEGAKKGAAYGCLYRAEPIDRPVLGEPTPDLDVWVRTRIDDVTPHNIHTADGGRVRRSEWGPARFAPVAQSTASSAAPGEDDIPF